MDLARFQAILEAYGAEPRRWPDAERAAAEAFAAAHAEAIASSLHEARLIDAVLDDELGASASDLLTARVLRAAPKRVNVHSGWRPAAALAACAVFGLVLGFSGGASLTPAASAAAADDAETMLASTFQGAGVDLYWLGEEG